MKIRLSVANMEEKTEEEKECQTSEINGSRSTETFDPIKN